MKWFGLKQTQWHPCPDLARQVRATRGRSSSSRGGTATNAVEAGQCRGPLELPLLPVLLLLPLQHAHGEEGQLAVPATGESPLSSFASQPLRLCQVASQPLRVCQVGVRGRSGTRLRPRGERGGPSGVGQATGALTQRAENTPSALV